jgi:hypothetical protein
MPNYNVYKEKSTGKWAAKKEGADRISALVDTQAEAEQLAKHFAGKSGGGEVRIHGRDGRIRDSDTVAPASDPNPPKDTKH